MFFLALFLILYYLLLKGFVSCFLKENKSLHQDKYYKRTIYVLWLFSIIGWLVSAYVIINKNNFIPKPVSYDVMITDEVNYNELLKHYIVIDTRDNITTIKVK